MKRFFLPFCLLTLAVVTMAQTNRKLKELPNQPSPQGNALFYVVDSNSVSGDYTSDENITLAQFLNLLSGLVNTNGVLATSTNSGGVDTNAFTADLRRDSQVGAVWRVQPWLYEPFFFGGCSVTQSNYLDFGKRHYTNGFYKVHPDTWIDVTDGWQGGRDSRGNIYENSNLFPNGMIWLVKALNTNFIHCLVYSQDQTNTSCQQGTDLGALSHIQQDASNFVRMGFEGVRFDSQHDLTDPKGNAIYAYHSRLMAYWMAFYSGKPCPMFCNGWDDSSEKPTFGTCQIWQSIGAGNVDLGSFGGFNDIWSQACVKMAHCWTNSKYAAPGTWQILDWIPMSVSPGLIPIYTIINSPIMPHIPYAPSDDFYGFAAHTNLDLLKIQQDPLGAMGHPVISNATWSVWVKELANGDRAVCLVNPGTNASVGVGFDVRDLGFPFGAIVSAFDPVFQTNISFSSTYTNPALPKMMATLFRCSPLFTLGSLQPANSISVPQMGIIPLLAGYGVGATEANYIGQAQGLFTNGYTKSGTRWIEISDGWQSPNRDANGNMVADAAKFPDGLATTVAIIHTNTGVKVRLYDAVLSPDSNGFLGSGPSLIQDMSNFLSGYKVDAINLSYQNPQSSQFNQNYAIYDTQAAVALQSFNNGQSFPLMSFGFAGSYPVTVNGLSEFSLGSPLDLSSQNNAWASLWGVMSTNFSRSSQSGNGTFIRPDFCPDNFGIGYPLLYAVAGSPIWFAVARDTNTLAPYAIQTNIYIQQILQDPAYVAPVRAVSNSTYQIWTRSGSQGRKYVAACNPSTNANVVVTFDATLFGYIAGTKFSAFDVWFQTNAINVTTLSTTVPFLTNLAFIVEISDPLAQAAVQAGISNSVSSVQSNAVTVTTAPTNINFINLAVTNRQNSVDVALPPIITFNSAFISTFYATNIFIPTNYVPASWVPSVGFGFFAPSNNTLSYVTTTRTNEILPGVDNADFVTYSTNAPVITGNGTATWYLTNSYGLLITNANITLSLANTPVYLDKPAVLILTNSGANLSTFTLTPSGFRIMTNGVPASAVVVTNLTAKNQHAILSLNCYGPGLLDAVFANFYDP